MFSSKFLFLFGNWCDCSHCSDITSVSWHLKSPASWLLFQQLVQTTNKENIAAPYYCLSWFTSHYIYCGCILLWCIKVVILNLNVKMTSKIGSVSTPWHHHDFGLIIVPLILIFWDVDEKHFTYAGFDYFSILISFYQLCWSYVFLFVVWDLLGKELTHICLCVWWQWINKTVAPLVW